MLCNERSRHEFGDNVDVFTEGMEVCDHKHRMTQLLPLLIYPGNYRCSGYYGCAQNELTAMSERHLKPMPEYTMQMHMFWVSAFRRIRKAFPPRSTMPLTQEEVVASSPQHKRGMIERAFLNVNKNGWLDKYADISSFVKWEKKKDSPLKRPEDSAPRLIQHRRPEFCYTLAQYIKPLEKRILYTHKNPRIVFTKGMTAVQIAAALIEGMKYDWAMFINGDDSLVWYKGKWYEFDHATFDALLRWLMLNHFRSFIVAHYIGDSWLVHLLMLMIVKGKTRGGIRYRTLDSLCSGDFYTSFCGNIMNLGFLLNLVSSGMDLTLLGQSGFITKYAVKTVFEEVEFCQCRPVLVNGRYQMVRLPNRVMSHSVYTCKSYQTHVWPKLVTAVGMCELSQNIGVPVLQAWSELLIRSGDKQPLKHELEQMLALRNAKLRLKSREITLQSRVSFAIAFGIDLTAQRELERFFNRTDRLPVLPTVRG